MIVSEKINNWQLKNYNPELENLLLEEIDVDRALMRLLVQRGLKTTDDIFNFLNPSLETIYSPFKLLGMKKAVERIHKAISKKEKIGIFSDSDMDGLTSLSIVVNLLKKFNIDYYYKFPTGDQKYEISTEAVDYFLDNGISLLITLDIGINENELIDSIQSNGVDVIVCDHHEQNGILPEAIIVNPKQKNCPYPFNNLAGVGVAFKMAVGILQKFNSKWDNSYNLVSFFENNYHYLKLDYNNDIIFEKIYNNIDILISELDNEDVFYFNLEEKFVKILTGRLENKIFSLHNMINQLPSNAVQNCIHYYKMALQYKINFPSIMKNLFIRVKYYSSLKIVDFIDKVLPFVSMGTIADVMPLIDENRVLLYHGLKKFNQSKETPFTFLKKMINGEIYSSTISWKFSPLLNSAGRMGQSELTASFLLGDGDINDNFNQLTELNDARKKLLNSIVDEITSENLDSFKDKKMIFIKSDIIPESFSGLVANRISEFFSKPAIVVSNNNERDEVKGSGRVCFEFDFFSYLVPLVDDFIRIGGHAQAFGFTINKAKLDDIIKKIETSLQETKHNTIQYADIELPLKNLNGSLFKNIKKLEPFGASNEEPVFISLKEKIKTIDVFGKLKNHLKIIFMDTVYEGIMWNGVELLDEISGREYIDLVYQLEASTYFNKEKIRINIIDIILK